MRRSRVRVPALAPLFCMERARAEHRGVAQLGSAFGSGPKGRVFKSHRPDHHQNLLCPTWQEVFCFHGIKVCCCLLSGHWLCDTRAGRFEKHVRPANAFERDVKVFMRKNTHIGLSIVLMLLFGAALGVASKLLDIYTSNLGNVFSQMSIWILICTIISIFSATKARAALNVFVFCVGMLVAYYATAELTQSIYGTSFIYGWIAFTICTPLFAVLTWMTKEKGILGKIIAFAVLAVTLAVSILLFDGPRVYDIAIILALAYFLFIHKIDR